MYLPVSKDILDSVSQRCAALLLVLKRIRRFPHGAAFVQVVIRLQYPFQTWRAAVARSRGTDTDPDNRHIGVL